MLIKIENTGFYDFCIKYKSTDILIPSGESCCFDVHGDFDFELQHIKSKDRAVFMTFLDTLISHERTRTVLDVNGKYTFSNVVENDTIKIKAHEYIPDKYISYKTFIFNCDQFRLRCTQYEVPEEDNILKKYKFLYLFSGINILLPICLCCLMFSILCIVINIQRVDSIFVGLVSAIACILLYINYLHRFNTLKNMLRENSIRDYMLSSRREKRTLEDLALDKHLYTNTNNDLYW